MLEELNLQQWSLELKTTLAQGERSEVVYRQTTWKSYHILDYSLMETTMFVLSDFLASKDR